MQKDDIVSMWGFEHKMVTSVALVRNIEHSSTKVTYCLEDSTGEFEQEENLFKLLLTLISLLGRINAHLWVEEGDAPPTAAIMLNTYARVIGAVRQQGDAKSIMIYKIQPVKGINEVNTHYLEVVNARYQAEEYYRGGTGGGTAGVVKMETDSGMGAAAQATQGGPQGKSFAVFTAIQTSGQTNPERGINRQELYRKFAQIPQGEMDRILEQMATDGHVYSTVDNDHFLACF